MEAVMVSISLIHVIGASLVVGNFIYVFGPYPLPHLSKNNFIEPSFIDHLVFY